MNGERSTAPQRQGKLLRGMYTALWYLALPALPLRLWWRGRKEAGYRTFIAERFGRYGRTVTPPPVLWVHAVSLGETNAARPLIARLRQRYPGATILLTHMTATGRTAGESFGDGIVQAWLPYDVPSFVRSFLRHFRPAAGMLLETELWPNLIRESQGTGTAVFLVNARLSERSAARYARIASLARPAFSALTGIAAQSADDASRIEALGGIHPVITGNLKFDVEVSPNARGLGDTLRERFGQREICLFASSREGEEALVLDAWRSAGEVSNALLLIVPRHPQRFDDVAQLLDARGVKYERRTDEATIGRDVSVVLGDSVGEMAAYCMAADAVLMGGSILPFGGQNLIEPIALGRPTLVGPHMFNFAEATASAIAAGAVISVRDAGDAVTHIRELLRDAPRRRQMEAAALAFHAVHRGATDRLWNWLAPQLDAAITRAEARSREA